MIIEIYPDWVLINGVKVNRPSRIARSEWMKWWENTEWLNGRNRRDIE